MRSQILAVLGISSVLLGIYMLVISLLNIQERPDYHIGCYLSNDVSDYSFKFKTKLDQLKSRGDASRSLDANIRNNRLIDQDLRKKAVSLTKNVEKYIQKLVLVKQYQQNNAEFFNQLALARKNYQDCAQDLNSNFDSANCQLLWTQYNKCLEDYNAEKQNLDRLNSQRNQILVKIQRLMRVNPLDDSSINLEDQLRKLKQKYDIQNRENDKKKEKFISQLKKLQIVHQTKSNQYDEILKTIEHAQVRYDSCVKNIQEFRNCEQISRRLSEYGHSQSWDTLEKRILAKRESLMKLQQLEVQSRGYGDNKAIKQMSEKRNQELKELMRLRIIMDTDQIRQCGCDQKTIQNYQRQLQNAKMLKSKLLKQLRQHDDQIRDAEIHVRQTDRIREKLINQFRKETQALKNRQNSSVINLEEVLLRLNKELTATNSQITDFSRIMNSVQFKCNQFKDQLSLHIVSFDTITKCLSKKDFYQKLRQKAELILKKDDASSLEYKKNIVNILNSVNYPKALPYVNEQAQLKPVQKSTNQQIRPSEQIESINHPEETTNNVVENEIQIVQATENHQQTQAQQQQSQTVYQEVTIEIEEKIKIQSSQL